MRRCSRANRAKVARSPPWAASPVLFRASWPLSYESNAHGVLVLMKNLHISYFLPKKVERRLLPKTTSDSTVLFKFGEIPKQINEQST